MHRIATKLLTATIAFMFFASGALTAHAQQTTTPRSTPTTQPRGTTKRPATRRPATRKPASKVQQAAAKGRVARPRKNAVMKAQKLPPAMLKFLKDWETNTANHNRLTAKIEKYVYDHTFFSEKRGLGEIKYEKPGKALLKLTPQDTKGKVSRLKDPSKKPYALEGITPERWVSTGKEIIQIDDKEKTYKVMLIPPDMQGERLNEGPIPFLFGMKAEEAQRRYHFYQRKQNPRYPKSFSFRAVPQRRVDLQEYKYADVILDIENYVPIAIKLTAPTGKAETVYLFKPEATKVNPKKAFWNLGRGPFIDPDVKGYKLVGNPGVQAVPGGGRPTADMQPGDARPQANEPQPAGRIKISGDKNPTRK
ncbi:hypothetical protein Pan258_27470 [Symmachiella dynata]|uniref:hypothetical protein n=1 Tax=Symmachiella dynata TaxID=2527995 RepID=UPI0011890BFE|nr:hypothetical protein [Symmachiella dynata]QDT48703.1 hypothetical protein Pan258_27470 [Symmachiella dynata]